MVRVCLFAGTRFIFFLVAVKQPLILLNNAYLLCFQRFSVWCMKTADFQIGMNHNLLNLAELQSLNYKVSQSHYPVLMIRPGVRGGAVG
jgi:hypothetical protein